MSFIATAATAITQTITAYAWHGMVEGIRWVPSNLAVSLEVLIGLLTEGAIQKQKVYKITQFMQSNVIDVYTCYQETITQSLSMTNRSIQKPQKLSGLEKERAPF